MHASLSLLSVFLALLVAPSSASSSCYMHPLYTWTTGLVSRTAFCFTVPIDAAGDCSSYGAGSGPSSHPGDPNAFTTVEGCCNDINRHQGPLLGPGPYVTGTYCPSGCLSCAEARESHGACQAGCDGLVHNPVSSKEAAAACTNSCSAAASDHIKTCVEVPAALQYKPIDVFDALCKNQGLTLGNCCSYPYKQVNDICTSANEFGDQMDFYWRSTVAHAGKTYRVLDSSAHDFVFNRELCGRCEEAI